jgi:hypothetical protein
MFSGTYYDKSALMDAYGPTSVLMADPSKGEIIGASSPNADGTGAQRGDKEKDAFATVSKLQLVDFFAPKHGRTKLKI